jgi:hypothetical protein
VANEFAGDLISGVEDMLGVATERDLLGTIADQELGIPRTVDTFLKLLEYDVENDTSKYPAVIEIANKVILDAEQLLNGYARSFGYEIPLVRADGTPEPIAHQIVAALAWIAFRQRRGLITEREAEMERDRYQRGELSAIARGILRLDMGRVLAAQPTHVHAVTSSPRMMSREKLGGL